MNTSFIIQTLLKTNAGIVMQVVQLAMQVILQIAYNALILNFIKLKLNYVWAHARQMNIFLII